MSPPPQDSCAAAREGCVTLSHAEDFDWVPAEGVLLDREEVVRVFIDLRAPIDGTDALEANRAYVVDIATVLARALERGL